MKLWRHAVADPNYDCRIVSYYPGRKFEYYAIGDFWMGSDVKFIICCVFPDIDETGIRGEPLIAINDNLLHDLF